MNAATQTVPAEKKVPAKKKAPGSSGKKLFRKVEPYIWIAPSVILMAVFILVPILSVFRMAMSDVSRAGKIKGFNGLENFSKVISNPSFSLVLKNTLVWTVAVVVLSTVLGFMLALVLNNKFRGRKIARAIVVFPWATTLVIQASAWNFIINTDYGTLNTLLMKLHIISAPVNWTPTPSAYFAWEIACGIFVTIPFVTFCVLSGLQSIDTSYYEAATVDGAGYFQKLFSITLPLVKSSLTVATVLNIIYVFNSFPIIWTMTKGDPANHTDTLVTYLYKLAFYNGKQGEAAAVSVIGFLILLMCASAYMIYTLRKGDEDL
ncbi:carbohydrate ABC transporter permease [uncultured Oscillibacter sp.]|uniref:carbohydrate ABC transporter permease n=1 Tax=uncultured Oscillibacter sp. TaxID=876091 RepID=UPI0026E2C28F|nr:sugar ABC transporter permease [uncultured Oscillibacter sp.]